MAAMVGDAHSGYADFGDGGGDAGLEGVGEDAGEGEDGGGDALGLDMGMG